MANTSSTTRLTTFYREMSPSLETVRAALASAGVDADRPRARDLYERDLDCHNLGMHRTLERLIEVAEEYGAPSPSDVVLDVGCGMGGPGRLLVDRFGCSVFGIDVLPLRIELAQALTDLTAMGDRISYRVADATHLDQSDASFAQAWMLDVSMHIRDKRALFAEIARVLQPGGLLVMHEQTGPLPEAMRPVTRLAPYFAPTFLALIRHVENAGLRVLTWRDTTADVLDYFLGVRAMLGTNAGPMASGESGPDLAVGLRVLDGYIDTLADLGGRTGLLVAKRLAG